MEDTRILTTVRVHITPFSSHMMLSSCVCVCLCVAFVSPPQDTVVARGSPALFNCSITSSVSASIGWRKDVAVLIPTSRITFLPNNSLLIDPTEAGDEGVYSCVVTSTTSSLSSSQNASLTFACKRERESNENELGGNVSVWPCCLKVSHSKCRQSKGLFSFFPS